MHEPKHHAARPAHRTGVVNPSDVAAGAHIPDDPELERAYRTHGASDALAHHLAQRERDAADHAADSLAKRKNVQMAYNDAFGSNRTTHEVVSAGSSAHSDRERVKGRMIKMGATSAITMLLLLFWMLLLTATEGISGDVDNMMGTLMHDAELTDAALSAWELSGLAAGGSAVVVAFGALMKWRWTRNFASDGVEWAGRSKARSFAVCYLLHVGMHGWASFGLWMFVADTGDLINVFVVLMAATTSLTAAYGLCQLCFLFDAVRVADRVKAGEDHHDGEHHGIYPSDAETGARDTGSRD